MPNYVLCRLQMVEEIPENLGVQKIVVCTSQARQVSMQLRSVSNLDVAVDGSEAPVLAIDRGAACEASFGDFYDRIVVCR